MTRLVRASELPQVFEIETIWSHPIRATAEKSFGGTIVLRAYQPTIYLEPHQRVRIIEQ